MTEQLANSSTTTLNGGIDNAVTSLTVTNGTLFPSAGNFRILIDSELILVGARSGNSLSSLTRGIEGTSAASHSNGANVTHLLTKAGLDQYLAELPLLAAMVPATSLPGSPINGQRAILTDSTTAPTYLWEFIYDSAISDANKWVCVGGAPAYVLVDTEEGSSTTGSWQNLATDGPSFTVPRAGIYLADFCAYVKNTNVGSLNQTGVAIGNGTPAAPVAQKFADVAGHYDTTSGRVRFPTLSASDVLKVRYHLSAGTGTWRGRTISVMPVRVA